jgi:hypothetical protein
MIHLRSSMHAAAGRGSDQFMCGGDCGFGGGPFGGADDGCAAGAESSRAIVSSQRHDDELTAGDLHFAESVELEAGDAGVGEGADGGLCGGLCGGAGEVDGDGFGAVDVGVVGDGDAAEDAVVGSLFEVDGHEARAVAGAGVGRGRVGGPGRRGAGGPVVAGGLFPGRVAGVEEADAVCGPGGVGGSRGRCGGAGIVVARVVGEADVDAGGEDGGGEAGEERGPDVGGEAASGLGVVGDDVDGVDATGPGQDARVRDTGQAPDEGFGLARELVNGVVLGARGFHGCPTPGLRSCCLGVWERHTNPVHSPDRARAAFWEVKGKVRMKRCSVKGDGT